MEISSSYKPVETLTTLYTMEELKELEELPTTSFLPEITTPEVVM